MDTKFTTINDICQLKKYIQGKSSNHKRYQHYTCYPFDLDYFYLSNGEKWNDESDSKRFADENYYRFAMSFSFSTEENVAMWLMYCGNNSSGIMLSFPGKTIRRILQNICEVELLDDEKCALCKVEINADDIFFSDVLYYSKKDYKDVKDKHTEGYYQLQYAGQNNSLFKGNAKFTDGYFSLKKYPWKYENETRLILQIPKEKVCLKTKPRFARIKINDFLSLDEIEIYKTPLVKCDDKVAYKNIRESKLQGEINIAWLNECKKK